MTGSVEPLRIGVLGAARISELSIVGPAAATGTRLVAVAARDRGRAETFAKTHGIERVHDSYADVIADPEVEAIYNPLANSLHAPWNKAAILAGKHVLTEKPFASNAAEAAQVRDLARGRSLVLFEGFHYLYHPLMQRLMSLLADGELGALQHVESTMFMSAPADGRPAMVTRPGRRSPDGPRLLRPARPTRPRGLRRRRTHASSARPAPNEPALPASTNGRTRDLEFPSGATGLARCSMTSDHWDMSLRVIGIGGRGVHPRLPLPEVRRPDHHQVRRRRTDRALRQRHVVHLPAPGLHRRRP